MKVLLGILNIIPEKKTLDRYKCPLKWDALML